MYNLFYIYSISIKSLDWIFIETERIIDSNCYRSIFSAIPFDLFYFILSRHYEFMCFTHLYAMRFCDAECESDRVNRTRSRHVSF